MTVAERADQPGSDTTERTPLLARDAKDEAIKRTPLPMASVAVLCFSRMYVWEPPARTRMIQLKCDLVLHTFETYLPLV